MHEPRKEHTLASAMIVAEDACSLNMVGSARLLAWALRREASTTPLHFHQGPAACAALLRP